MPLFKKRKFVVAMSGGVDSSVAAAILKNMGHEVIGITLRLYDLGDISKRKGACCAGQDIYDATITAEKIGIPHYVFDYESIFKTRVIEEFADSYIKGKTPIPCINCNQKVKFLDMLKAAKSLNADNLITGHYVRKKKVNGKAELHKGIDPKKDQSYFLFNTSQAQLEYLDFPLGSMHKKATRELAKSFGLEIAEKPDSQDICFVPDGNYANVVKKLRPSAFTEGNIITQDGKVLGKHKGIALFTIGQRRGISISAPYPLYVVKIIPETNTVVVGKKEELISTSLSIKDVNWLYENSSNSIECKVRLRSAHEEISAVVTKQDNNKALVKLKKGYQGITPGQACVMYKNSRVLGGGWIE